MELDASAIRRYLSVTENRFQIDGTLSGVSQMIDTYSGRYTDCVARRDQDSEIWGKTDELQSICQATKTIDLHRI